MSTAVSSPAGSDETGLIFGDERRGGSRWRLGGLIIASLLAHAASFYVLQVAYTPTGSLLPPPARVVLVPLDQPENAALARWLSLTDPALTTQAPASTESVMDSLGFRYQPSYDALPAAFKPLEAAAPAEGVSAPPRPLPPGPVDISDVSGTKPAIPANAPEPTRVILSGGIEDLAPMPLPPMPPATSTSSRPTEPTVFLVGVRSGGGAPYLFPARRTPVNNANGNADETDDLAREYLARLHFRPTLRADGSAVWGRATVYWGTDARPEQK